MSDMNVGTWCLHCGKPHTEPATEKCRNPQWHDGTPEQAHYNRPCESGGHCPCFDNGLRCCTCRDREI